MHLYRNDFLSVSFKNMHALMQPTVGVESRELTCTVFKFVPADFIGRCSHVSVTHERIGREHLNDAGSFGFLPARFRSVSSDASALNRARRNRNLTNKILAL